MDTTAPAQTALLQLWQSSGDESCAKGRRISWRVVAEAAEDGLGFCAFEPLHESGRAFGVSRVLDGGGIVDKRLRLPGLASDFQNDIGMLVVDILPAQVNFLRQRDVRQMKWRGLD